MPSLDTETDRRKFLTAAGGAAATALAGCSSGGNGDTTTTGTTTKTTTEQQEFPVTITQGQMPTTLDPHDHRSTPTDIVVLHAYEGVLSRSRLGKIEGSLAHKW